MPQTLTPEDIAQQRADEDAAALAEALEATSTPGVEDDEVAPQQGFTLADRYNAIADLIVDARKRTKLSESTLIKVFEVSLQYHAWDYQRAMSEAQQSNPFAQYGMSGDTGSESEGLVGPEPDEILGAVEEPEDNIVPVDFTPAQEAE